MACFQSARGIKIKGRTSESSLYLSALSEAYPSNAKAHFNYAASIMDKDKELEDVIEKHLKEAISLNELYTAPYITWVFYTPSEGPSMLHAMYGRAVSASAKNPIVSDDRSILERNLAKLKKHI